MNFSWLKLLQFVQENKELFKTAAGEATDLYRAIEDIVQAWSQPQLIGSELNAEDAICSNAALQAMALASVDFSSLDDVAGASRIGVGSGFIKFLVKYWPVIVQILELVEELAD